ncbi:hypothetical protein NDU88_004373 [Pleurodeles waltl]|uniref:Uncharacterized protein n=1 Tax=Pleurodeles waltl TaxID=8319 RepID=A0AAV7QFQ3_PLEWA|nr:hypothetical protein NDU88_004373 [Pleurodeles waltl]
MSWRGGSWPWLDGGPDRGTYSCPPPEAQHDQEAPMPNFHDDKLDKFLKAIAATCQDLHSHVDTVTAEVGLLLDDQKKLSTRVTSTASELKDLRPPLKKLEGQVQFLTKKVVSGSWSTEQRMQRADPSGATSK